MVNGEYPPKQPYKSPSEQPPPYSRKTQSLKPQPPEKPKKYLLFIIIGIIILAIIVIVIFYFTSGSRSDSSLEGVSSSGETRESKLQGSPHPGDTEFNERGWTMEEHIWTFPEDSQERLEDAYELKLYRLNNPVETDAEYYSRLNCIDYLMSSALENLSPPSEELVKKLDFLLDSNLGIAQNYHNRRLLEEFDSFISDELTLPPELNLTAFGVYFNKTEDSSESCINQPVPEKYKEENKIVVSVSYLETEKVKEYYKSFYEAYSWQDEKPPLCGNGILDGGELCDYAATDEINNPYGDQCLVLCNVGWTNEGWSGCWGNGISVCTDHPKVTDQYFIDNPKCIPNSNCVKFLRCNDVICPDP